MNNKNTAHLETGEWGEKQAEFMLKKKGYRIIGRRVRVGTHDEIDIVAGYGDILVFVEVKTRKGEIFGRPVSAVDRKKRHLLSRAAVRYLKGIKNKQICFRFDIVEVIGCVDNPDFIVRHIENAFKLDKCYSLPY